MAVSEVTEDPSPAVFGSPVYYYIIIIYIEICNWKVTVGFSGCRVSL